MSARAAWRLESLGFRKVYRYQGGRDDWLANGLPFEGHRATVVTVARLARPDVPTCGVGTPIGQARERAQRARWRECVVINDARVVLGIVRGRALDGDPSALVEDVMDPGPWTERLDSPAVKIARELREHGLTRRLVTTGDGVLVGMFFAEDASGVQADEPQTERLFET
jgi:CBS domain-containing protein